MGASLVQLEQALRSNQQEKITSDEANLLMEYKARVIRDFTLGAGAGAGIAWLATRKFSYVYRITIAGGSAAYTGLWRFGKSLDSCAQNILGMQGTRIQAELARIMLRRNPNDQRTRQLVSKHFYSENVFDDLTSQLKSVWRRRNFFIDHAANPLKAHDSVYGHDAADLEPKQISVNNGFIDMANPFDCVFGLPPQVEEMHRTSSSEKSPRKQRRSHKRTHRKHRVHSQEAP